MTIVNTEAAQKWDGEDGEHWTLHEDRFNSSMRGHAARLLEAAALTADEDVLDVGCGCGVTTREAARAARSALGVDLSTQMLARATEVAAAEGLENVSFRRADAQVEPFDPVDVVISRFGVMFFDDPGAAFTNLRRATRPGGRLCVMVWRTLEHSEWVSMIRSALAAGRDLPVPPPGAPWPLGFGDPEFVQPILERAGWSSVGFTDIDEPLRWGADLDDAMGFIPTLGVVRALLEDLDPATRATALDELRDRLSRYVGPGGVEVPSGSWVITARA